MPAGSASGTVVVRATVGGSPSSGVICDSVALCWKSGGAGVAVQVPERFALGACPPSDKPRMDGELSEQPAAGEGAGADKAQEVKGLFDKKPTKEEKKAAAAAAKSARAAKKASKGGSAEEIANVADKVDDLALSAEAGDDDDEE